MKNIVYILVCASVIFFTACSSQDKKKDGTQVLMQDSTEIAGPQRMQVSDVKTSLRIREKSISLL